MCDKNSRVTLIGNSALDGGVMFGVTYSMSYINHCEVFFINNKARISGELCTFAVIFSFHDSSIVTFADNIADNDEGGAICTRSSLTIIFEDNSTVSFAHNNARNGGAIIIIILIFVQKSMQIMVHRCITLYVII